jgi:hypothetical protein
MKLQAAGLLAISANPARIMSGTRVNAPFWRADVGR